MNRNELTKSIDNRYVTKIVMDDGNILDLKELPEKMKESDLLNWVQVGAWPEIIIRKRKVETIEVFEPWHPMQSHEPGKISKLIESLVHGDQYIRLNAKRVVYFETEEMEEVRNEQRD